MKRPLLIAFLSGFALIHLAPCEEVEDENEDSDIPINTRATAAAWTALRSGDLAEAIEHADECIERFRKPAATVEAILEQQKVVLPTGPVAAEERKQIDRYQILHDVATCLLIKGWAEEKLGRQKEAIESYAQARKFPHARTTEHPGGDYWAPAEVAAQNLQRFSQ